ncbi:myb-related transcription factor, partner of profilin-like [Ambystoma mexicanum]|uniref:myb-related transcription factor, partner of profilin-like n=1 Tax=Ambystoma mexicanum TaxID=8296 RepID=UPI0037E7FA04
MSKASRKSKHRLRKKRFSDEELNMLADTLAAHAEEINTHNLKREVQLRKKEIWEEVTRKVYAVGTTPRTVKDCTDGEDASEEPTTKASTSRAKTAATGKTTSGAASQPTPKPRASAQAMAAHEGQSATPETGIIGLATAVEGEASGTHSAETSSVGETAATAPLSDIEIGVEEYVDEEGLIHVACPHTPSPQSSPQPHTQDTPTSTIADPALHSSDLTTTPEASPANARPVAAPSTTAAPTNLEARLARVEARQDTMLELVRQYVAEGEDTRQEMAQAIVGNTATINASAVMMQDSLGAVMQVLTSILLHMQQQQPAQAMPITTASTTPPSSTPASSAPSNPVRLTRRSGRQSEMLPPDTKKAWK